MWYNRVMGWWNKLVRDKQQMVNNMTEEQELLVIFMEEAAEASMEASKLLRFGKSQLESEIGDLMCMITLLEEQGHIDMRTVMMCSDAKREKLKKWSNLNV